MDERIIGHKWRRANAAMSIAAEPVWGTPPDFVEARHDEVHVWRAFLDVVPSCIHKLSQVLSVDERERAERFRFQRDRRDFIVARALLRILLGHYLQREPDRIQFSYGSYGKPFLVGEDLHALRFNLSHSDGLVVYAVARGREIGIDLERISERVDTDDVAKHYFSPNEVAALRALPQSLQSRAFFSCWTRKESYLKAQGDGLSVALDSFSVSLSPDEPASLLSVKGDPGEISRWSLLELDPDAGYVAALTVEGHNWLPRYWQLPARMKPNTWSQLMGYPITT